LEAHTALELSDWEMRLVAIVITDVLSHLSIGIPVQDNTVAVQVCAPVELINAELFSVDT
jgi:hypothetical protein